MAAEVSAGVLAWRRARDTAEGQVEFLLVHPGGPFWARRDQAAWSLPKGLVGPGEETWAAAAREFEEELGQPLSGRAILGAPQPLTPCRTPSGKTIHAWLVEADIDVAEVRSNLFEMEWPRGSGRVQRFPEVDRAGWFDPVTALAKIHRGQRPILLEAGRKLGFGFTTDT